MDTFPEFQASLRALVRSVTAPSAAPRTPPPATDELGQVPWAVLAWTTLAYCAALKLFSWLVANPIAALAFGAVAGERGAKTAAREAKFVSAAAEMVVYASSLAVGAVLVSRQSWLWPTNQWWEGGPQTHVEKDVGFFYIAYAARYLALLIVVLTSPRKKDFHEMILHHVVTAALVILSYASGWIRVGVVIMVLFDIADPFLHAAKTVNYLKEAAPTGTARQSALSTVTDALFGTFALSFFVTRILVFTYVALSCFYEPVAAQSPNWDFFEGLENSEVSLFVCQALIFTLYALQWFWFALLVDVVKRTLRGEDVKDNRSDDEGVQTGKKRD